MAECKASLISHSSIPTRDCRGCDGMVVEFKTTCAISRYHH